MRFSVFSWRVVSILFVSQRTSVLSSLAETPEFYPLSKLSPSALPDAMSQYEAMSQYDATSQCDTKSHCDATSQYDAPSSHAYTL